MPAKTGVMSGIEQFRKGIIETCDPDMLQEYISAQRVIQKAIKASIEPSQYSINDPRSNLGLALQQIAETPISIQDKLYPHSSITKAAMLVGAVSFRSWLFRGSRSNQKITTFEDVWSGTQLQRLAAECDTVISDIVIPTTGNFTSIDLPKMIEEHTKKSLKVKENMWF